MAAGREVSRAPLEPYYWTDLLTGLRTCEKSELPDGFADGWHYTAPLAAMPVYLDYLRARFERADGTLAVSPVGSLASLAGTAPVVVNCSGVGVRSAEKVCKTFRTSEYRVTTHVCRKRSQCTGSSERSLW